ncbi:MAG: hypothetical protein PHE49_10290 [bacterium]|nr:hypothetical protein [bacterium]
MKKNNTFLIIAFLLVLIIPLVAYFNQQTEFTKIVKYYSDYSPLIIAVLTLAYVITTMLQLFNMQNQLNIMEKNLRLQNQTPLLIPSIETFSIEKIQPYVSPEDKFTSIIIMNRIHSKIFLRNNSVDIPFNVHIFPTLILKDGTEIPQPHIKPEKISIIFNENSSKDINFMFFDDKYKILEECYKKNFIIIRIEILYKNIFGAGFYSKYLFSLFPEEKAKSIIHKSINFIKSELPKFEVQRKKHKVLKSLDENEARKIFKEIKETIKKQFDEDMQLKTPQNPIECEIETVNFDKRLELLKKYYSKLVENYKVQYDMFNRI